VNRIAFLDLETTGLADRCDVWEIGLVVRDPAPDDVDSPEGQVHVDTEYSWLIRPDLTTAEPAGLRIGRYYQRIGDLADAPFGAALITMGGPDEPYLAGLPQERQASADEIAARVASLLDGATIVGAVPDFDDRHLRRFLRRHNQAGTWHYHLVDVETFAGGLLGLAPPWDFDTLLGEFGLTYDEAARHTALGDARMVRDLYDKVIGKPRRPDPAAAVAVNVCGDLPAGRGW
jgi:hypothetical protein